MNRISRRLPRPRSAPPAQRRRSGSGAGLMLVCGLLYGLAGFVATALPPEPWLWGILLLALGLHLWAISLAVAPPGKWLSRLGQGFLQLLAVLGITLPLAIAMNYLGSDQLNDITILRTMAEVVVLSLGAAGLALLCRWATDGLGRRLSHHMTRRQMRGVIALVGILGLTLGGVAGLLISWP